MPFIISLIGVGISFFMLKESRKSNTLGIIGLVLGAVSTIAMIIMLFIQSPDNPEDFDVVNYYKDGTLHYTGNGSYEDRDDIWKWYSTDGILIKFETYDDNELNGKYKEFYKNGNIKIDGEYDDGEKNLDEWKCYNLDGSIKTCQTNIK